MQSRDITSLLGSHFAFLAGDNEFEGEKCMYGNASFRDTNIYIVIVTYDWFATKVINNV